MRISKGTTTDFTWWMVFDEIVSMSSAHVVVQIGILPILKPVFDAEIIFRRLRRYNL